MMGGMPRTDVYFATTGQPGRRKLQEVTTALTIRTALMGLPRFVDADEVAANIQAQVDAGNFSRIFNSVAQSDWMKQDAVLAAPPERAAKLTTELVCMSTLMLSETAEAIQWLMDPANPQFSEQLRTSASPITFDNMNMTAMMVRPPKDEHTCQVGLAKER